MKAELDAHYVLMMRTYTIKCEILYNLIDMFRWKIVANILGISYNLLIHEVSGKRMCTILINPIED